MVVVFFCENVVTSNQIAGKNTIIIFTAVQPFNMIKEFSLFRMLKCVIVTYSLCLRKAVKYLYHNTNQMHQFPIFIPA